MNNKEKYKRELENSSALFIDNKLNLQNIIDELVETSTLHYQTEWDMDDSHHWVLLSWNIKFLKLPNIYDTITISTEIIGHIGFFIIRNYKIQKSDGGDLIDAYSVWTIIDEDTRSIIRLPKTLTQDVNRLKRSDLETYLPIIDLPEKYKTESYITPTKKDIDSNNHVNNAVYFKWLEESIPNYTSQILTDSKIKVIYKKEILPGEKVRLRIYKNSDRIILEITDSLGEEIKALMKLEK